MQCRGTIGLYRFYNTGVDKLGEPFALCEAHAAVQKVPDVCYLRKIADKAVQGTACEGS